MGRSRATVEEWEATKAEVATHLPKVVAETDALVAGIADTVSRLPPDRLLHRAWWELAVIVTGVVETEPSEPDQLVAMRMIDYIQSVIASVEPIKPYAEDVAEEVWLELKERVRTLFTRLSLEYQMCRTASLQAQDPDLDMALEEFRVKVELWWANGRGKRYQPHERQALIEVLAPQSEILERLFGIDAATLVSELEKILSRLTQGLRDTYMELDQLRRDSVSRLSDLVAETDATNIDSLWAKVFEDPHLAAKRDRVGGALFGLDLFDVEKTTKLPKVLLDELTWSPGEEREFFAPGPFKGWPVRVWPTTRRPFICLDDRILCFDMFALFDNIYRVLQRSIFQHAPDYKITWNGRQNAATEALPFIYFRRLLPGTRVIQPAYYRWNGGTGPAQWHEADGLVIYDDHLLVVEVKAGAFTYTSPATDLPAHIDSLRNLVMSPASQGSRFIDFLESAPEVPIANRDHVEIGRLRRADFRHVTVCAVTLDAFTQLAARAQHLRNIGIDVGQRSVWVLSIDDLRVFSDIFDNPLIFLHYAEQRMRAARSDLVDLSDEVDHLGLYLAENNYSLYATELAGSGATHLTFDGYGKIIDDYYSSSVRGEHPIVPKQKMPERFVEIVDYLASSSKPQRSAIASFLLDAAGDYRETIAGTIDQQLRNNLALGRPQPVTTYGDHPLTLWTWSPTVRRHLPTVTNHARAVVAAGNEPHRLVLELEYSAAGRLVDANWQYVDLAGLSQEELSEAYDAASALRGRRVAAARAAGKIGRNQPCPCGSGRKHKHCCLLRSTAPTHSV